MNAYYKTETDTDIQNKLAVTSENGGGGEAKYGYGIKRHKLLCIKYISNMDILYSTGKYSHHFVITLNGI